MISAAMKFPPRLLKMSKQQQHAEVVNALKGYFLDVDSYLFGEGKYLDKKVDAQKFKPLSEQYLEWKERMLGRKLPPSQRPLKSGYSKVRSLRVWERTGAVLDKIVRAGRKSGSTTAGMRKIKVSSSRKGAKYATFLKNDKLKYWEYPDDRRRLFILDKKAKKDLRRLASKWANGVGRVLASSE